MREHPARVIARKREGAVLTAGAIRDFVTGVVDGAVGDAQLGAFLMAVCCRGMDAGETAALTLAMRDSGRVLEHPGVPHPRVDKHSTGGVGDKVSLVLAPLVAAAGVPVPMVSGRGLGHTGGTIDKLEAIPGYRTGLDPREMTAVLRSCGFAMAAAGPDIAPADRRMYAVRDVTATVESIPLITASILSKKLAEGIDGLVMDVKVGRAAFLPRREDAGALRDSLVATGAEAGLPVRGLLTDMDHPLGRACGNAVEVAEAIECLRGGGPGDLREVVLALGAEMLAMAGKAPEPAPARETLAGLLADGSALESFRRNVEHQGGDPAVVDDPARLPAAPVRREVTAASAGRVTDVDPRAVGLAVVDLGGGRRQPGDTVDPAVGIVLTRRRGDGVGKGDVLATVHARDDTAADRAVDRVGAAFGIGDEEVPARSPVLEGGRS